MAESVVTLRVDATSATRALNGVQNKTNKLQSAFGGLKTAIGGVGLTLLAKNAIQTSANFEKLNIRLGLLTKATGNFAEAQKIATDGQRLFGLSATEALEGVTNITARLKPLGTSLKDIRTTFIGFNTAAKLGGANAQEASNAFRQLAQALGSGRLAGDEFRSVSEQIPLVLKPLAEELNVSTGELKKLAAEGQLTSDVVIRALSKLADQGGEDLKAILENDPTQVFKNLTNETENLSRAFGDLLKPAVLAGTKELTKFIEAATEFVNSDAGQASFAIAGVVLAVKSLTVAIPAAIAGLAGLIAKLQIAATASALTATGLKGTSAAAFLAAGGITKMSIALVALKTAIAATGIGLLVIGVGALATKLIEATKNQKEFNKALKEGDKQALKNQLNKLFIDRQKLLQRLGTAQENNNKRAINSLNTELDILHDQYNTLRDILNEEIKTTNQNAKTNDVLDQKNKNFQDFIAEQEESQKLLQASIDGNLEEVKLQIEINKAVKEHGVLNKQKIEDILKANEALRQQKKESDELKDKFDEIGESIENGIKNNLRESIIGAQTFGDAMNNILINIRNRIIDAQLSKIFDGVGENFSSSARGQGGSGIGGIIGGLLGGFFANGGQPPVNKISVVGEKGPELFVPRTAGTIIPNNQLSGGITNNYVTVNVQDGGVTASGNNVDLNALGQVIGVVVQAQLIKEKQAGGILTR